MTDDSYEQAAQDNITRRCGTHVMGLGAICTGCGAAEADILAGVVPAACPKLTDAEKARLPTLRKWRCHKVVEAARIVEYHAVGKPGHRRLVLEGAIEIDVPFAFTARGNPAIGDFFVRYEDGYESWSPAKAFEDGYTKL